MSPRKVCGSFGEFSLQTGLFERSLVCWIWKVFVRLERSRYEKTHRHSPDRRFVFSGGSFLRTLAGSAAGSIETENAGSLLQLPERGKEHLPALIGAMELLSQNAGDKAGQAKLLELRNALKYE